MDHLDTLLVLADPNEPELALLAELPDGISITVGSQAEVFAKPASGANIILNWSQGGGLLREVFLMAPRVRWVHCRSAGLDGLLFPELVESPVPLTNGRGAFSDALAEFAIGAALFFAKDFRRMVRQQEAGLWAQFDVEWLAGSTLGIVGYGDIGRAVAMRAKALGMRVLALRRHPEVGRQDPAVDETLGSDALFELLRRSDYVVLAAPLTPATRGLVGEAGLAAMKASAVLINLGRGPVVEEGALVRALAGKRIRGAALDVFDPEPLPAGHPFFGLDNLLLSPHCADHTADWLERAMRVFLDNYARFRRGDPLLNVVEKNRGY